MSTYKCMNELIREALADVSSNCIDRIINADEEDINTLFRYWLVECDYPVYELLEDVRQTNILVDFKYKFGFDPLIEDRYMKYYQGYSAEMALGAFTSSVIESIIDYPGSLYKKLDADFVNDFMDEMQDILEDIEVGYDNPPDLELYSYFLEESYRNGMGANI